MSRWSTRSSIRHQAMVLAGSYVDKMEEPFLFVALSNDVVEAKVIVLRGTFEN